MFFLDLIGSSLSLAALLFLTTKNLYYWIVSIICIIPNLIIFFLTHNYILIGLQLSYLVFDVHGWCLWKLEASNKYFNKLFWYNIGWIMVSVIFIYSIYITDFTVKLAYLQVFITALALIGNYASTRKYLWSWLIWIGVDIIRIGLFNHIGLVFQSYLQLIKIGICIKGYYNWQKTN